MPDKTYYFATYTYQAYGTSPVQTCQTVLDIHPLDWLIWCDDLRDRGLSHPDRIDQRILLFWAEVPQDVYARAVEALASRHDWETMP